MAHDAGKRGQVRRLYVTGRTMEEAAIAAGISEATARRWREAARAKGDDWDESRDASFLAGEGLEERARRILTSFLGAQELAIKEAEDPALPAADRVRRLAMIGDSFSKTMREMTRFMPERSQAGWWLAYMNDFQDFITEQYPGDPDTIRLCEMLHDYTAYLGDLLGAGGLEAAARQRIPYRR